jgi:vacuolar-type H+-ATPase subunit E/Vma4
MAVNGISKYFSAYVQQVVSSGTSQQPNAAAAATQEATETKAQTLKEAQNGDRQAIKKLQREKQAQQQTESSSISESGKGAGVDAKV